MTTETNGAGWTTAAVLVGRLIFAALFIMAVSFKLMDINATATAIATAGFPAPHVLAWVAAVFELALIVCFVALGGKPGRVRIVHRSFHVCCGPSVCGRAWPRTRVGDEARMAQAVIT